MQKKAVQRAGVAQFLARGFWLAIARLPLVLPAGLAAFGSVAVICLLAEKFSSNLVWPVGLLAATITMLLVFRLAQPFVLGGTVERRLCDILVIIGLIVWAGVNMNFNAQHVITDRDPATYAVAGRWLVDHDNLKIPLPDEFQGIPGVVSNSLGFSINHATDDTYIYAQGQHLLPALLGLAGRSQGVENMLKINVVFGAVALLSVYGFARLLGRPRWAVVVTAALAASMPFIYFSRDTYTEPLAATFTFGGLALLVAAMAQQRLALWFVAGLVLGAGALTRIDAYLTFIGIAVFMAIYVALATKKERAQAVRESLALSVGLAITGALGLLDVIKLAHPYFVDLHKEFRMEIAGLVLAVVAGAVLVVLAWHTPLLKKLERKTRPYRGSVTGLVTVGFILALACRPFIVWYTDRLDLASTVPSAHSYAEITTYWVAWYLGPILALIGLGGFTLAASRTAIRRYNLVFLPGILVVAVTCLVYLLKPSITPDQIWASRRLLPVILPGVAAFAVMALDWISREFFDEWQFGEYFAGLTAVALVVGSLFISSPLVLLRDTAQLSTVTASCKALPANSAVLLVGLAGQKMMQPLHAFCGTPAAAYVYAEGNVLASSTLKQVAQQLTSKGKTPIIGVFGSDAQLIPAEGQASMSTVAAIDYRHLEQSYLSPPQHIISEQDSLMFGRLQPNGSIAPLR